MEIRKAVIPVAGLGTRFLPATKAVAKALVPIFNKPLVQFAVEEAVQAGITEIALVQGPGSEAVGDYFKPNGALEGELASKGKHDLAEQLAQITKLAEITTIFQSEPLGLGHAVSLARDWVGDEPFAVLLPDDLVWGASALGQLVRAHKQWGGMVLAGVRVSKEQIPHKGIIDIKGEVGKAQSPQAERIFEVAGVVEKPSVADAPSDMSIVGRYILHPAVFEAFSQIGTGAIGEIQLTDAIQKASERVTLYAVAITGRHTDAGNPRGMFEAILEYAKADADLRKILRASLKN